jgi:DNA-binding XRE family transcriptional regulator
MITFMVGVRPARVFAAPGSAASMLVPKSEHGYDTRQPVGVKHFRNRVTMSPVQSRMARAALGWGVRELAAAAQVSPDTIARLERGEVLYPRTIAAIQAALEAAGVEFLDPDNGGPGVRLNRPEKGEAA